MDWTPEELDLIVADYFDMLQAERTGVPYVKARHNAALREKIERTKGAVEFKHRNISAVLVELGLPTIRGYIPATNFQDEIFDAIERFLSANEQALHPEGMPPKKGVEDVKDLFIEPPPPLCLAPTEPKIEGLRRLIRKFDPVERDFRNRTLGEAGEKCVVTFERNRLALAGRHDLAEKVRWVSKEDGDGAGYDIHSYHVSGADRLIEVKTTVGGRETPFFLTRNEMALSNERPQEFRLYRLFEFSTIPRLFKICPPLESSLALSTETWRAGFK